MSNEYVSISIPKELIVDIDKFVGKKGFSSRAEVVKAAIREYLDEHKEA
jgi:metal-responsive CopG/Arc/MetJ family transcriptional regulator